MRFLNKIRAFLYGRYGVDALYYFLTVLFLLIWVVRIFVKSTIASLILYAIELFLLGYSVYRSFSRNIYARRKENERFLSIFRSIKNFFSHQLQRIKDIKRYRYRACPHCKAKLRLPKNRGSHTVKCPRCGERFETRIIL